MEVEIIYKLVYGEVTSLPFDIYNKKFNGQDKLRAIIEVAFHASQFQPRGLTHNLSISTAQ